MSNEEHAMSRPQALKWKVRREMGRERFIGLYAIFFLGGPVGSYKLWRWSQGSGDFFQDVVVWTAMAVITGGIFRRWLWKFNEAAFEATPADVYRDEESSEKS